MSPREGEDTAHGNYRLAMTRRRGEMWGTGVGNALHAMARSVGGSKAEVEESKRWAPTALGPAGEAE